jgi:signal transduction histidine kinase
VALIEDSASLATRARHDPALALLLLRFVPSKNHHLDWPCSQALTSGRLLSKAATLLQLQPQCLLPWQSFAWQRLWQWSSQAAQLAEQIAGRCRLVAAERAYWAALLAPLGWYAVAVVNQHSVGDILWDPQALTAPRKRQRRTWGMDHAAIARRLAVRWRLPGWLAELCGTLHLSWSTVTKLIHEPHLWAIVNCSWNMLLRDEPAVQALGLIGPNDLQTLSRYLGVTLPAHPRHLLTAGVHTHTTNTRQNPPTTPHLPSIAQQALPENPYQIPLLVPLLRQAAGRRRCTSMQLVARLERQVDALHRTIARFDKQSMGQLRAAKLAALAEFAAGAAHEINNPLAIISAQVQGLLRHDSDPQRRQTYQVVLQQTQRVAELIRAVLTFARPPHPQPSVLPLPELLLAMRKKLQPLLDNRQLTLEVQVTDPSLSMYVDAQHMQQALGAVLSNAAEMAPQGGWVRLRVEADDTHIRFIVEDNGSGLTGKAAEHAFDPFYSGKEAGRGSGLGLPLAWRLLRQNGGDIVYAPRPEIPGRFLITVPRHRDGHSSVRKQSA